MLEISKSPNRRCRVRNREKRAVGAPFGRDAQRADLLAAGRELSFDMGGRRSESYVGAEGEPYEE